MKHKSIGQRLKSIKTDARRKEMALEWSLSWATEQEHLIHSLGQAVKQNDFDRLCKIQGKLKEMTIKRFTGLNTVINKLTEEKQN